jgi:AbrB family looped-hinge helix DNA binding protein
VVIPKEIRRSFHIYEGDPMEIFLDKMDGQPVICLRKYETGFRSALTALADTINDEMKDSATLEARNEIRDHFNKIANIIKEWEDEG